MTTALDHWRAQLAGWAIPESIRQAAGDASPWRLDPALFRPAAPARPDDVGLATRRAAERLPAGGTVLDVGCGGGAAALALVPPAGRVVGVDESADMLEAFAQAAASRPVEHDTVLGRWPDVAASVGEADVVVAHHVVYNVADLDTFAHALTAHARYRVVLELTARHPQTRNAAAWRHFWDLDRPTGPSSSDALAVLEAAGIPAIREADTRPNRQRATPEPRAQATQVARLCCLPPDRLDEVMAFLAEHPPERTPPHVIWWDVRPDHH